MDEAVRKALEECYWPVTKGDVRAMSDALFQALYGDSREQDRRTNA